MQFFDAQKTRDALPFNALIDALEAMFIAGCEVPLRHTHKLDVTDAAQGTVLIMPAWQADAYLGIKTVNIFPGNSARGLPGLFATYVLYDAATGRPLAQLDGDEITARRTAAASALGARYLARSDARHLLIVGAGRVARLLPEAYKAIRPIDTVSVWSRRLSSAEALVAELAEAGIEATVREDLQAAVGAADIVSCATLATEPVVRGEWLRPGTHLDLIGSFTPQMREADDACFVGSRLYIDTPEALMKAGELLGPMSRGVITKEDVVGTLEALCRKQVQGRKDASERTVFKSVGTALEDLAAAKLVYAA